MVYGLAYERKFVVLKFAIKTIETGKMIYRQML